MLNLNRFSEILIGGPAGAALVLSALLACAPGQADGASVLAVDAVAETADEGESGEPVKVQILVSPETIAAGAAADVVVRVHPRKGVKINRYPQVRLEIVEQAGLLAATGTTVGNDAPPPPDKLDDNYFETVDPLELRLQIDAGAISGEYDVEGELSFAYCVVASGYCAPTTTAVRFPIAVR